MSRIPLLALAALMALASGCIDEFLERSHTGDGEPQQRHVSMAWSDDENRDQWVVTQATNQMPLSEFHLKSTASGAGVQLNADARSANLGPAGTENRIAGGERDVSAGDFLSFCGPATGAQFTLVYEPIGAVMHQFRFDSLRAC